MSQHASSQHCAHSVLCWPVRLSDVKSLNCWGQDLADVSILSQMPNVEVLSLSVNQISTLKYVCEVLAAYVFYVRLYKTLGIVYGIFSVLAETLPSASNCKNCT